MARKRQKRSNVNGQEEMVSALYDFAATVEGMVRERGHSWKHRPDGTLLTSPEHLDAIGVAMDRIATGFGYRIVEIQ